MQVTLENTDANNYASPFSDVINADCISNIGSKLPSKIFETNL